MTTTRAIFFLFGVIVSVGAANNLFAQNFPSKPVRMIGPEAGGGGDLAGRIIAQGLNAKWGQPVIIDNRGGNATIPVQALMQSQPDGYTLLIYSSTVWLLPFLQDAVSYDPVKDLAPVTLAVSSPNVLVVNPTLPVNSTEELISLAKAKPGALNYGTSGTGSSSHLAAALFQSMTGINIVRVPYKGLGPAMNDLIGGQLQLLFLNASAVMPHVKAGRLKALAVTSATPSALAPGLPTIAATGVPGYESASINGVFARAKTPNGIIRQLNRDFVAVLSSSDVKQKFLTSGADVIGNSPEEFAASIKADMSRLGTVLRNSAGGS